MILHHFLVLVFFFFSKENEEQQKEDEKEDENKQSKDTLYPLDSQKLAIMGKNIESFVANGTIEVTSLDFNLEVDIDKIRNLIESIKTTGNSEQSNILHSTLSEDESSVFEKMVREIRDGRNVNIYSSDASSSLRGSDYFEPVALFFSSSFWRRIKMACFF